MIHYDSAAPFNISLIFEDKAFIENNKLLKNEPPPVLWIASRFVDHESSVISVIFMGERLSVDVNNETKLPTHRSRGCSISI